MPAYLKRNFDFWHASCLMKSRSLLKAVNENRNRVFFHTYTERKGEKASAEALVFFLLSFVEAMSLFDIG